MVHVLTYGYAADILLNSEGMPENKKPTDAYTKYCNQLAYFMSFTVYPRELQYQTKDYATGDRLILRFNVPGRSP